MPMTDLSDLHNPAVPADPTPSGTTPQIAIEATLPMSDYERHAFRVLANDMTRRDRKALVQRQNERDEQLQQARAAEMDRHRRALAELEASETEIETACHMEDVMLSATTRDRFQAVLLAQAPDASTDDAYAAIAAEFGVNESMLHRQWPSWLAPHLGPRGFAPWRDNDWTAQRAAAAPAKPKAKPKAA